MLPVPLSSAWEEVSQSLKHHLTAPILAYADFTKPFVPEVDASHRGLGLFFPTSILANWSARPDAFASHG